MNLITHGHKLLYEVAFSYRCSFRKVCGPVPPISSVFEFLPLPQVQPTSASISRNSEGRNGGAAESEEYTKDVQSIQYYNESAFEDEYSYL